MTLVDDRVLEYINEHGHGSPSEMKNEGPIRYSRQHIARRCRKLAERDFLQHVGNGVYVITDTGIKYLEGELDAEEINGENGAAGDAAES
jgi:repressor of nif and glnA expression